MRLSELLKQHRERQGLSMEAFAKAAGLSKPYISMLEKEKNSNGGKPIVPSLRTMQKIAAGMGMKLDEMLKILDGEQPVGISFPANAFIPKMKKVPLLGATAAGRPIFDEHFGEYAEVEEDVSCDFALIVKGDSMIGDHIQDGDLVFIQQTPDVDDGQIAAIEVDGEVTLKHIYHGRRSITLVSSNPAYAPMVVDATTSYTCHIMGRAVCFQHQI